MCWEIYSRAWGYLAERYLLQRKQRRWSVGTCKTFKDFQNRFKEFTGVNVSGAFKSVDLNGNIVIECKYDYVQLLECGVIIVKLDEKYGCIDLSQNVIVPIICNHIFKDKDCKSNAILTIENQKCNITNNGLFIKAGDKIINIPNDYIVAKKSTYNLIAVCKGHKWGFIDENLNTIIPCEYDSVHDFDVCISTSRNNYTFQMDGKSYNIKDLNSIKDFLICPVESENLWGAINYWGDMIIKPKYSYLYISKTYTIVKTFKSLIATSTFDKYESRSLTSQGDLIVRDGIIPSKYDWGYEFYKGYAHVFLNEKWGLIDKNGNEIIPCIYECICDDEFYDDFVKVRRNAKYGYVNSLGKELIPCIYDWATSFNNGKAIVGKDNHKFVIDIKGRLFDSADNNN